MKLILPIEVAAEISPHLPPNAAIVRVDSEGNLDGDATDAEVYLSWFNLKVTTLHKVLAAAPALRWHHAPNAGVDRFLTPTYLERNLILTNGAGIHAIPIAESVIGYILAHAKRLSELYALQAEHHWKNHFAIQELKGATLLIIGAGGIGQEIALRARAFGMRIFASRRRPEPLANFDKVVGADDWRSLLPEADYAVIATPLTPATKGSFDEAALRLMQPHAYLINIARGAIVDEPALLKALSEGWIAGAALDTFITEPLPPDSPFWSLPNVLITPHCSAHSPQVTERSLYLFLDNLHRYRSGIALRNVVDKKVGY